MTRASKKLGEFDLKVLIKTCVITHKNFIAALIDHKLCNVHMSDIASRLKEPVDKVKGALEKLEQDGWLVCEEVSGEDKKVIKPTLKGMNVYGSFEAILPEWGSPESLHMKYGSETGKMIFCKLVIDCFYRVLKEKYGETFREVIADN